MSWLSRTQSGGFAAASATNWQIDLAGLSLCGMLTLAAYLTAVRPMLAGRQERADREIALTETREQASRMVANTRRVRAELNSAQGALAKIEISLRPSNAINERLAELTALAGECGLEVQAMQPGALSNSPRFGQLPIQVSGVGNYRSCNKFLRSLRQAFPDTAMRAFELSANPADTTVGTSFNFQLVWYVQPNPVDNRR